MDACRLVAAWAADVAEDGNNLVIAGGDGLSLRRHLGMHWLCNAADEPWQYLVP
jgi:hypothetical protein